MSSVYLPVYANEIHSGEFSELDPYYGSKGCDISSSAASIFLVTLYNNCILINIS